MSPSPSGSQSEQYWGKLSVRDVAKRMGVSVATLYRHVGKRGAGDDTADAAVAHG